MAQSSNKRRRTDMEQAPTSPPYGAPYESMVRVTENGADQSGANYNEGTLTAGRDSQMQFLNQNARQPYDHNLYIIATDNNYFGNDNMGQVMNTNPNGSHPHNNYVISPNSGGSQQVQNNYGPIMNYTTLTQQPINSRYLIQPVHTDEINMNSHQRDSMVNYNPVNTQLGDRYVLPSHSTHSDDTTTLSSQQRVTSNRQRTLLPNTSVPSNNNSGTTQPAQGIRHSTQNYGIGGSSGQVAATQVQHGIEHYVTPGGPYQRSQISSQQNIGQNNTSLSQYNSGLLPPITNNNNIVQQTIYQPSGQVLTQNSGHHASIQQNQNGIQAASTESPCNPLDSIIEIFQSRSRYTEACGMLISQYRNSSIFSKENDERLMRCLEIVKKVVATVDLTSAFNVFTSLKPYCQQISTPSIKKKIKKWIGELEKQHQNPQANFHSTVRTCVPGSTLPDNMSFRVAPRVDVVTRSSSSHSQQLVNMNIRPQNLNAVSQTPVHMGYQNLRQKTSTYIAPHFDPNYAHRVINNAWGPVMLPYGGRSVQANRGYSTNTFYVSPEQYSRILRSYTSMPRPDTLEDQLPITYRLICRKSNYINHENMCDWPDENVHDFEVSINSHVVKLHRKRSYFDRDNYEHYEGNDSAVEVSNFIKSGKNEIVIKQCFCEYCFKKLNDHVLSIEVQLRETREVILYWARSQLISEGVGKALVQQLTNVEPSSTSGDDELIVTSNLTIDLRCPYTFTRIREPARGLNCRHLSCFELFNFVDAVFKRLEMDNKRKDLWRCPICDKRITSGTLRIDSHFLKLSERFDSHVAVISLTSSGDWVMLESHLDEDSENENGNNANNMTTALSAVPHDKEIIVIDDDDEDDGQSEAIVIKTENEDIVKGNEILSASMMQSPPSSESMMTPIEKNDSITNGESEENSRNISKKDSFASPIQEGGSPEWEDLDEETVCDYNTFCRDK